MFIVFDRSLRQTEVLFKQWMKLKEHIDSMKNDTVVKLLEIINLKAVEL